MKLRSSLFARILSVYVLVNFLFTLVFPTMAMALTSGPYSPEFSDFTPVSATDMVNLFSGDFSYNVPIVEVPGPHNSGYAVSLSYNSGASSETEASWVGFGWTLNPGAINRELRGFPDEYAGQKITYYNKTRPNWTVTSSEVLNLEILSKTTEKKDGKSTTETTKLGGINFSFMNQLNNSTGYQKITSVNANIKGKVGIDASFDANGVTFSPYVSPLAIFSKQQKEKSKSFESLKDFKGNSQSGLRSCLIGSSLKLGNLNISAYNTSFSVASPPPYNFPEYDGVSVNWSATVQGNLGPVNIGVEGGFEGSLALRYGKYFTENEVYGYLNTSKAEDEAMLDYYIEKDGPMKRTDLFVGIPFNNQDYFNVTGEGVLGGFRAYNEFPCQMRPKKSESGMSIYQSGFEAGFGSYLSIGLDLGVGSQKTLVSGWGTSSVSSTDASVFRFNNDLGGQISYGDSKVRKAGIMTSGVTGFKSGIPLSTTMDNLAGGQGSTSIELIKDETGIISGFSICNKEGKVFQYQDPVFVKNETSLAVDISDEDVIKNKYLAFKDLLLTNENGNYTVTDSNLKDHHHRLVSGEINKNKYANTFLLTEILSPDYVDADTISGPSDNDFGGWTKFSYREVYGDNAKWYRYRMPYNGLRYQQNSISDTKDDIGSVNTGEKEVKYLKTIETKTHVAYFVTNKTVTSGNQLLAGSGIERKDGRGAKDLTPTGDPAALLPEQGGALGDTELEYLEKVVLFAKNSAGTIEGQKPLKVIHFQYDYTLVPNVPNNKNSNFNYQDGAGTLNDSSGKLTLKKVWTEYEGIVPAKISPYVFNYFYPNPDQNSKLYSYFAEDGYNNIFPGFIQNPSYKPYALDPWGSLTPNGDQRRNDGIPWVDQSAFNGERTYGIDSQGNYFDPAAYQLKSIQLPSGGTVFIQYEAKDYTHVQNREAMAMAHVNLAQGVSGPSYKSDSYIVDVSDLGCDPSNQEEVSNLVGKINKHFQQDMNGVNQFSKKIYFKFLFSLLDGSPNLDNHLSEYITGYANFNGAELIELSDGTYGIKISMESENSSDGERALVPRQLAMNLL